MASRLAIHRVPHRHPRLLLSVRAVADPAVMRLETVIEIVIGMVDAVDARVTMIEISVAPRLSPEKRVRRK